MKRVLHNLDQRQRRRLLHRVARILAGEGCVGFCYAYGTFVGDLPFHDLDLGIYLSGDSPASPDGYGLELAARLGRELSLAVDVRVLNQAPVTFLYHVLRGVLVYQGDAELRARVVERTIRSYLDVKTLIRRGIREAFAS